MTSFREYRRRLAEGDPPEVETITLPREARPFQGMRAGIVTRFIANAIDFGVMVVALGVTYAAWAGFWFLLNPASFSWPTVPWGVFFVGGFAFMALYFTVAFAWTGRTYGDYLMGLRVVNFRGDRLRLAGALLRGLFCTALPLGLFWVAVSRQNRSVQDVVLRTSVIYDWAVSVHHAQAARDLATAQAEAGDDALGPGSPG